MGTGRGNVMFHERVRTRCLKKGGGIRAGVGTASLDFLIIRVRPTQRE